MFGALVGGVLNAGLGILGSSATAKAQRQYRQALMNNIAANDAAAAAQKAEARGYQQAAVGDMQKVAAETNAQNRALQAMGASNASAAAQAQKANEAISGLASKGAQQTLAASQVAQNKANAANNKIRGDIAGIAKQHISDVAQMYKNVGDGVADLAGMTPWEKLGINW